MLLSRGRSRGTIPIVEDSKILCQALAEGVANSELRMQDGYQVVMAFTFEDALSVLRRELVSVLVTDIFMPGLGGIEGIQMIRKDWPSVPILAISAGFQCMASDKTLSAATKVGADATLPKPFDQAELVDSIRSLLVVEPTSLAQAIA